MYRQGFVGAPTFCFDRACQCVLAPLYFANQVTNQDHNPQIDSLKISMNLACPARFEPATYALKAVKNELKQLVKQ